MGFCADREGEHVEEAGDGRRVGRLAVGNRQDLPAGTGQHCGLDAGMTGSTKRETGQRGNAEPGGHQCLHRDEIVGGERYLRREPGRFALPEQVAAAALAACDPAAVREVGQVRLSGEGVLAGWRRPPKGRPVERGSAVCGPVERGSAVCGPAERGSGGAGLRSADQGGAGLRSADQSGVGLRSADRRCAGQRNAGRRIAGQERARRRLSWRRPGSPGRSGRPEAAWRACRPQPRCGVRRPIRVLRVCRKTSATST